MKMKKIILNVALIFAAAVMGSCDSFFEVDTDDTLDGSEYISEESEMYSGYMGIMAKMQAVGDKAIYLNELRGELVDPPQPLPQNCIACTIMMMIWKETRMRILLDIMR